MTRALLFVLLPWGASANSAHVDDNTVEIAPGVHMPLINLGGVHEKPSNYSLWLDVGGRGLDTAWSYGEDVQIAVGNAVAASPVPRAKIFVTTKVPCCPDGHSFYGYACSTWAGKSTGEVVQEAAEADLKQLQLGYADLILLHFPCDKIEDTRAAYKMLENLKVAGKTRAIGISNFNSSMIDALMSSAEVKPAVNQCGFSIGNHDNSTLGRDMKTVQHCQNLGITYAAYSPLGGLSGVDVFHNADVLAVAKTHNKSAAEVALRWVVQQGVVAVTASDKASHDVSDLAVFNFKLDDAEMQRLAAIGQQQVIFA